MQEAQKAERIRKEYEEEDIKNNSGNNDYEKDLLKRGLENVELFNMSAEDRRW
jgi:hypothetical protein